MSISKQELEKLCVLSRLRFSEEELESFSKEIDDIITFADTINNAVDGGTEDIKSVDYHSVPYENLREDIVEPSLDNERILSNVDGENGFFRVARCVNAASFGTGHSKA